MKTTLARARRRPPPFARAIARASNRDRPRVEPRSIAPAMSRARSARRALTLTLDMFKPTRGRPTPLALATTLVRDGVIERPSWYDAAVHAASPSPRPMKGRKPREIAFETDGLIRGFYKRDPSRALEPIDCASVDGGATTAKRYADRQLEIMRARRMNEREASVVVDAERAEELARFAAAERLGEPLREDERVLTSPGEGSHGAYSSEIERVQAGEEETWSARLERARRNVGEEELVPRRAPRARRGA